jgi:predicted small secreted protein
MGVNVNQTITLASGLSVDSYYSSIGTQSIEIAKNSETGKYDVNGTFIHWKDKAARDQDLAAIGYKSVSTTVDSGNVDMYSTLYTIYKATLTDYTDVYE